jgi:hypothetical protein
MNAKAAKNAKATLFSAVFAIFAFLDPAAAV